MKTSTLVYERTMALSRFQGSHGQMDIILNCLSEDISWQKCQTYGKEILTTVPEIDCMHSILFSSSKVWNNFNKKPEICFSSFTLLHHHAVGTWIQCDKGLFTLWPFFNSQKDHMMCMPYLTVGLPRLNLKCEFALL